MATDRHPLSSPGVEASAAAIEEEAGSEVALEVASAEVMALGAVVVEASVVAASEVASGGVEAGATRAHVGLVAASSVGEEGARCNGYSSHTRCTM